MLYTWCWDVLGLQVLTHHQIGQGRPNHPASRIALRGFINLSIRRLEERIGGVCLVPLFASKHKYVYVNKTSTKSECMIYSKSRWRRSLLMYY